MNREILPGASNALTFGIIAIISTLICCGPFGAIFGFIGLSKAKSAERLYHADPDRYTGYENVKTGKVLSYIGLAIAAILLVFTIIYFGAIIALVAGAAAAEGGF